MRVYHLCDRICVLDKGHIETVQEKKEFLQIRDQGSCPYFRLPQYRTGKTAVRASIGCSGLGNLL